MAPTGVRLFLIETNVKAKQNRAAKADPEVLAKPQRRRFTTEYKLQVLRQYEATPKGERGAFLRRERLYSSHIDTWRRQAASGQQTALAPKKRGRKAKPPRRRRAEA